MRILVIRGENLASLAGAFEISFETEPLRSSGLFAICGPTGSGKSTLLDALCLALYNKTPRLRQATTQGIQIRDVGDNALSQHDPRNLLRRGCSEGFAEVDFVGSDGVAYRAHWSVRRARNHHDGRLQAVEMHLIRLQDQQRIGATNKEVLTSIEQCLGLNFEQFTRGVLLAQNEFSSFLKACDNDRASLLETLTGTDIYSRISMQTYERSKLEAQKLAELTSRLAERTPLDNDAREALETQLVEATQTLDAVNLQHQQAQQFLSWLTRLGELRQTETQAQQELVARQRAHAEAQPQREHLALLQAVEEARPLMAEFQRLEEEQRTGDKALTHIKAELLQADNQVATAQACQDQASEKQRAALQARQVAGPQLQEARQLDTLSQALAEESAQQKKTVCGLRQEQSGHQQKLKQLRQAQAQAEALLAQTQEWLAQHHTLEPLVHDWTTCQQRLEDATDLNHQAETLKERINEARTSLNLQENRYQQTLKACNELQAQQQAEQQKLDELQRELEGADQQALDQALRRAETQRLKLHEALTHLQQLLKLEQQMEERRLEQAKQRDQFQQLQQEIARLDPILRASEQEEQEAQIALERARLAHSANIQSLRQQLRDEEPCMVCGSLEHPFLADTPRDGDALIHTLEKQWQEARANSQAHSRSMQRALANQEQMQNAERRLHEALSALQAEYEQSEQEWRSLASQSDLSLRVTPALLDQVQRTLNDLTQQIEELEQQRNTQNKRRTRFEQLLQSQRRAQETLQERNNQRQEAQLALAEMRNGLTTLNNQQSELGTQLKRQCQWLGQRLPDPDWHTNWLAAPVDYLANLQSQVAQWQAQTQVLAETHQALRDQDQALGAELRLLDKVESLLENAQKQLESIQCRQANQLARRQALFDGEAADLVEKRLELTVANSTENVEQARHALQQAKERRSALQDRQTTGEQLLSRLSALLKEADGLLHEWLAQFNASHDRHPPVDRSTLQTLLAEDRSALNRLEEALKNLDQTLAESRTVLEERRLRREAQEAVRPAAQPGQSQPNDEREASEWVQALFQTLEKTRQHQGELHHQLRKDNEHRQATAALSQQIEKQTQQSYTWQQLSELIGSSDGKRFRNYAQQLTLDMLLQYANQHLRELADRYRLQRIPDTLALQVVDRDMGDELRSVHSLSGGESFLVSLALALGLASLSSNQVRVESLFIDEGFGSLDEETLRVAMDALDNLQAQGRKVGVITHVQEMIERINTQIRVQKQRLGTSDLAVVG